jgi:hypothetical protein
MTVGTGQLRSPAFLSRRLRPGIEARLWTASDPTGARNNHYGATAVQIVGSRSSPRGLIRHAGAQMMNKLPNQVQTSFSLV